MFLASKLIYVLQVFHCSRVHIDAIHRIFACFIWSSWEPLRRNNLFLPLEKDGLGVVHLFVRQLLLRFFYLKGVSQPSLLAVLQNRLCYHRLSIYVTTGIAKESPLWGFLKNC